MTFSMIVSNKHQIDVIRMSSGNFSKKLQFKTLGAQKWKILNGKWEVVKYRSVKFDWNIFG